jgi:hypothetical protein
MSLASYATHAIPLTPFQWNVTDLPGAVVKQYSFPHDFVLNPASMVFGNNAFLATGFRFTIQISGTSFHQGRLVAYWSPEGFISAQFTTWTVMAHVDLDASTSCNVELVVPFVHPQNWLNTLDQTTGANSLNTVGTLAFVVQNQLGAATLASQALDVTTYVALASPLIRVLTYNHPTPFGVPITDVTHQSGVDLGKTASSLVGSLFGKDAGKMAGQAVSLAETLGPLLGVLDHPNTSMNGPTDRTFSDFTHSFGGVASTRLGLKQDTMHVAPAGVFATDADEMDLRQLVKLPSLFKTLPWTSSNVSGDLLTSGPMSPTWFYDNSRSTALLDVFDPTLLAYVANAFTLWKGGIVLTIETIASEVQRGRLLLSFHPGLYSNPTFDQAKQNMHWELDLRQNKTFRIALPYVSISTYKLVNPIYFPTPPYNDSNSTGTWALFVLNGLAQNPVAPQEVDINIKVSADDDFDVRFPGLSYPYSFPIGATDVEHQSAVIEGEDMTREEAAVEDVARVIAPVGVDYPEDHMNLGNLLKRPFFRFGMTIPATATSRYVQACSISGSPPQSLTAAGDILSYFSGMYRHYVGPMRFSINTDCSRNQRAMAYAIQDFRSSPSADYVTPTDLAVDVFTAFTNGFMDAYNLAQQQSFDVTMSWGSPYSKAFLRRDLFGEKTVPDGSPLFGNGALRVVLFTKEEVNFHVFSSLGDETRFLDFIGPRTLTLPKASLTREVSSISTPWEFLQP